MSRSTLAIISLCIVNLIYGINYPIAKGIMSYGIIKPSGFILLRDVGAVILFALLALGKLNELSKKDIPLIALCAVFGVAVNQLGFFHGLSMSSTVNAGIIMTLTPIMVMVMSSLLLNEPITKMKAVGVFAGAIGALIIVLNSAQVSSISAMKGDVLLLVNAMSYGLFLVLIKPLMAKYDARIIALVLFTFGSLYVSPFGAQELAEVNFSEVSTAGLFGLAFVVIGATFTAYLLNIFALRHVNPTLVAAFVYIQPMLAMYFSWLFTTYAPPELGGGMDHFSTFTWLTAIAGFLIFAGVFLVARANMRARPKHHG